MIQGQGWGRRRRGYRISRFLEPCLLLLLHREDSHGYDMLERLEEFALGQETLDSSVVYRYLRDMEERGLVTSTWDTEGGGAPRRVYQLTKKGDEYLAWWIGSLRRTRDNLDRFIHAYEAHMKQEDHFLPEEERTVELDNRI